MQTPRRHLFSIVAMLMLVVLAYPLICSGVCLLKPDEATHANTEKHSCCHPDNKSSDSKKSDCRDEHLAFNKAIGQFFKEREQFSYQIACIDLPSFSLPTSNVTPADNRIYQFYDTGPPDSGCSIRIWIESYQI